MACSRRRTRRRTVAAPFLLGGLAPKISSVETRRAVASRTIMSAWGLSFCASRRPWRLSGAAFGRPGSGGCAAARAERLEAKARRAIASPTPLKDGPASSSPPGCDAHARPQRPRSGRPPPNRECRAEHDETWLAGPRGAHVDRSLVRVECARNRPRRNERTRRPSQASALDTSRVHRGDPYVPRA